MEHGESSHQRSGPRPRFYKASVLSLAKKGKGADEEEVLEFGGRSVLYLVGAAIFDTTCCGVGGCGYVLVPGHLVEKHVRQDDSGAPVSLVEPIKSESLREELRQELLSRESVNQVNFL